MKEIMEKTRKNACEALKKHSDKGYQSIQDIDAVYKLTKTLKNAMEIEILDEEKGMGGQSERYSRGGSYGEDEMYSEARGRGRYAKRDSMGRYSRDGGSYDSSYGSSYGSSYARGYSNDGTDHLMHKLGEAMEGANHEERKLLEDTMRKLEKL